MAPESGRASLDPPHAAATSVRAEAAWASLRLDLDMAMVEAPPAVAEMNMVAGEGAITPGPRCPVSHSCPKMTCPSRDSLRHGRPFPRTQGSSRSGRPISRWPGRIAYGRALHRHQPVRFQPPVRGASPAGTPLERGRHDALTSSADGIAPGRRQVSEGVHVGRTCCPSVRSVRSSVWKLDARATRFFMQRTTWPSTRSHHLRPRPGHREPGSPPRPRLRVGTRRETPGPPRPANPASPHNA